MSLGLIAFCKIFGKVEQYHIVHTDVGEIAIPKFDGSNYKQWASKVKVALQAIGAWRIVTGEFKDPGNRASSEQQVAYRTLNDKGFALIFSSLEQEVIECVGGLDSMNGCKGAWHLFQFTYSDASEESMFPRDILEDIRELNNFEDNDIEEWIRQRKETIIIVKVWYERLKLVSKGAKSIEIASLLTSLIGTFFETFLPAFSYLENIKTLMFYGRGASLFTKVAELVGAEGSLLRVRAAIQEDVEKSKHLRQTLLRMARLNTRFTSEFDVGLCQYFWFRMKCKEFGSIREVINFKQMKLNSEEALQFAYVGMQIMKTTGQLRYVGEASLATLGVGNRNRTLVLGAAVICLDVCDLYAKYNENPEYVEIVKRELESLENELRDIEKGYPSHRDGHVE